MAYLDAMESHLQLLSVTMSRVVIVGNEENALAACLGSARKISSVSSFFLEAEKRRVIVLSTRLTMLAS